MGRKDWLFLSLKLPKAGKIDDENEKRIGDKGLLEAMCFCYKSCRTLSIKVEKMLKGSDFLGRVWYDLEKGNQELLLFEVIK